MKSAQFSMKTLFLRAYPKAWRGMALLSFVCCLYYSQFFSLLATVLLAIGLTGLVYGMIVVGFSQLGQKDRFSMYHFIGWTAVFTLLRWLLVFYILQYYMPSYTVFHYPEKAIYYLAITSAALLFIGYCFAIYQKGQLAREQLKKQAIPLEPLRENLITIKSEGKLVQIKASQVIFIQARGEYVQYHTTTESFLEYQRMKVVEANLRHLGFQRIHWSYLVNLAHVVAFSTKQARLSNRKELPISNSFRTSFFERVAPYFPFSSRTDIGLN